ncbi:MULTISPECIES: hypothetical protein [unclassified Micromonospora]|uniref:hypothetical protein n=1 Tax=unclassified Micromonospora TaxID=2617518 RepID=UPI0010342E3F|nr:MULTISPECIES: hypothetical protein [unclassified Micromonospora]QKW16617.1 hypothetical protein HUT12_30350 [Verrucosispora sp. NA02020]TBL33125.1 hypothetical protein EYA84_17975 [Verrucosispora sp. SN26_14.1]
MALTNRYKSAPGAGTLAALIMVLVFGSPWYADWARDNTDPDSAGGWFLRLLAWPAWRFDSSDSIQEIFAADLKAILVVVMTFVFLYLLPGSQLARARGTLSQFFAGWAAFVFAGAFAALLTALIRTNPSLLGAFQAAGDGAEYGLFTGWIIGIATLGGYRGRR